MFACFNFIMYYLSIIFNTYYSESVAYCASLFSHVDMHRQHMAKHLNFESCFQVHQEWNLVCDLHVRLCRLDHHSLLLADWQRCILWWVSNRRMPNLQRHWLEWTCLDHRIPCRCFCSPGCGTPSLHRPRPLQSLLWPWHTSRCRREKSCMNCQLLNVTLLKAESWSRMQYPGATERHETCFEA